MSSKREKLARAGMIAKGMIYAIIGVLTAMAAFNLGGEKSGSGNVLAFLAQQPFGKILLGMLAIGLFGYTFYRINEALFGSGDSWGAFKGFLKRSGFIVSGIFYGALGITAIKMILMNKSTSGGDNIVSTIINTQYGPYLIIFVAICLLGKSAFQFYKAYTGKFRDNVKESNLSRKERKLLIRVGKIGFISRGVVSAIIAFIFFKVAVANKGNTGSKVAAFDFLEDNFGSIMMGVVALGLVAYAIFMFIQARYAQIRIKKAR